VRRIIETRFSQLEEFGVKPIRTVSRKGLAVKDNPIHIIFQHIPNDKGA
jgi:hypothetical protein